MKYLATINTPGYSPWDDEPPTFDTAKEAWEYLADERQRAEEDLSCDETCDAGPSCQWSVHTDFTDTVAELRAKDDEGTVISDTPGYHGDHDLGLAYTVTEVPDPDEVLETWLRIPEGEEEAEAEANTFQEVDGRYRVDWDLSVVGLVTSDYFHTLAEAHAWLESEGFSNYTA